MATLHGQAAGKGSRTYHAWKYMLQRCRYPSHKDWGRYGGRGITVCERWQRFDNFLADMGRCPEGLTLDRINNEGNYEPGNCRWATWEQQYANRRSKAGELHWNAKLTTRTVLLIRELASHGYGLHELARLFGVSDTNVAYIVERKTWRHLPPNADVDGGEIGL